MICTPLLVPTALMAMSLNAGSSATVLPSSVATALSVTWIPTRPPCVPLTVIRLLLAVPPPLPAYSIPTPPLVMVLPLTVGVPPVTWIPRAPGPGVVIVLLLTTAVPSCTSTPTTLSPMVIVQLVTVPVPRSITAWLLPDEAFTVQNCSVPALPDR